jgi:NTE family protein
MKGIFCRAVKVSRLAPIARKPSWIRSTLPWVSGGLALLLLSACATRPVNPPLTQVDKNQGYRGNLVIPKRPKNDPATLVVLAFSGGGTRAAALSYGVLEELKRTEYTTRDGQKRRLLDEVDVVSGVSGGSFTALSYALYGDQLFDEYEQRFLKRNVQGELAKRNFLYPSNWFRLMSGTYGRSEVAADYYDEILFEGATFNDLMQRTGPLALATGTDITTGSRFSYYQEDFDLICSDLGPVKLSRAAATSSAVPIVLSPVTLSNYGGSCNYEYPPWVEELQNVEPNKRPAGRIMERFRQMEEFTDGANRPYIHLVDGGVSDNIGARGILDALEELMLSADYAKEKGADILRRLIFVVVNARSASTKDWQKDESPPGSIKQLAQSTGVPIERYSFETVELIKDRAAVAGWRRDLMVAKAQLAGVSLEEAEAQYPKIDTHVMDVNFENLADADERSYFMNLPTSFVLTEEQVDRLREVGGRLLRESTVYQDMLQQLDAQTSGH